MSKPSRVTVYVLGQPAKKGRGRPPLNDNVARLVLSKAAFYREVLWASELLDAIGAEYHGARQLSGPQRELLRRMPFTISSRYDEERGDIALTVRAER